MKKIVWQNVFRKKEIRVNEIVFKRNDELVIEPLIQRFLNYIDVSDNTIKSYNVGLLQFNREHGIQDKTNMNIWNNRNFFGHTTVMSVKLLGGTSSC